MKRLRSLWAMLALMIAIGMAASVMFSPGAIAQDDGTPVAGADATPVADADGTPAAEPIRVITLVAWYETDPSGDFIQLGPLASNDQLIAGPGDATTAVTGSADFDGAEDDGTPEIILGDTTLVGVPAIEGDPESMFRWTFPQEGEAVRPATLVIQVVSTAGPYEDFSGSATFISRSIDPGSGILVVMLNPPDAEA
jgi:hypothetical protein